MEATRCASCGEEIQGPFLIYQGETYCKDCVVTCQDCGEQIPPNDAVEYEGEHYCHDCCEECAYCGEEIPKSELTETADGDVCEDCIDENYSMCEDCECYVHNDRILRTEYDRYVCQDCIDEHYVQCCRCHDYVHEDEAYWDIHDDPYCCSCRNYYLSWCDGCERYVPSPEVVVIGDGVFCEACAEEVSPYARKIKLWNYKVPKRDMLFCRHEGEPENNKLFFGMEIEMDRRDDDPCTDIGTLVEVLDEPYAIYKTDGSLNNGIECVTTPMSFAYLNGEFQPTLQKFCETATDMGYRSHDTSTCGLHIHVSEAALGAFSRCRASDIVKTVNCDHNWKFMALFSRRKGDFEYCNRINPSQWMCDTGRYVTVNRNNMASDGRGTVEFRLFKGTLKWQSILAAVDLCKLIVDMVNEHDDWVAWEQIVEAAQERNYEYFLNYLEEQKILEKLGAQELEDEQFTLAQAA